MYYRTMSKVKYITTVSVLLVLASFAVWGYQYAHQWQNGVKDHYGFNLGIDFTGGSTTELQFSGSSRPSLEEAQAIVSEAGLTATTQTAGDAGLIVRTPYLTEEEHAKLRSVFEARGGAEQAFSSVGPTLGAELQRKALLATAMVLLAIILYISYAFRGVSHGSVQSWMFGVGAITALVHDIILVLGVFIVLGVVANIQIDSLFVTALLTVLGFSVHDTIVVYDRIREGLKQKHAHTFEEIVDMSINSTLARSINTSLTTLFVLTALYFFGGETIQHFVLALIVGIIVGTYSSIFIASPALLFGEKLFRKYRKRA